MTSSLNLVLFKWSSTLTALRVNQNSLLFMNITSIRFGTISIVVNTTNSFKSYHQIETLDTRLMDNI